MKPVKPAAAVFQFPTRKADAPEAVLPLSSVGQPAASSEPEKGADLTGRPKVWFCVGRGRVGKTTLIRFAAERAGGERVFCAAAGPPPRSLTVFRSGVAEPPSNDPAEIAAWLKEFFLFLMQEKSSALVDFGGGDTGLDSLLSAAPDLAAILDSEGVVPIAMHVIGPDAHDLAPMVALEAAGFRPAHTAIVCNEALGSRDRFEAVLRHSAFRAARERGALRLWMPKLDPDVARMVNDRQLQFGQVGNSLGPFNGAAVRKWLAGMDREFGGVESWIP